VKPLFLLTSLAIVLTSCGDFLEPRTIRPKTKKSKKLQKTAEENSSALGNLRGQAAQAAYQKQNAGDGIQVGKAAQNAGYLPDKVGEGVKIQGYTLPSDDQIVWSDDFNPEADIAFDKPFLKPVKNKGGWGVSFEEARRESMTSGKPVVMWFTNQKAGASPACKKLSAELFSKTHFTKWAGDEVVRLRLDLNGGAKGAGNLGDETTRKRQYLQNLKKRYRVLGLPTVIVLAPDGEVVEQYRGFTRGQGKSYFQRLKDQVLTQKRNTKFWRSRLERKGYREWTGANGRLMFARLSRYSRGRLILVEPDGRKSKTTERQLSKKDREWLAAEKAKRNR